MRIVKEYIKLRKSIANTHNEEEYKEILDLSTIGVKELEKYTEYLIKRIKDLI